MSTQTATSYSTASVGPQPAAFTTAIAALPAGVAANLAYSQTMGLLRLAADAGVVLRAHGLGRHGIDTFIRNAGAVPDAGSTCCWTPMACSTWSRFATRTG